MPAFIIIKTYGSGKIKSFVTDGGNGVYKVGIDIGSVSINFVVIDEMRRIVRSSYVRHMGRPMEVARDLLSDADKGFEIDFVAATGTGGKTLAPLIGAAFVNEIVAITKGFDYLNPHVRTVVDIGGEDSKLIIFESGGKDNRLKLKDFSMNALCAAGTGSFLDQQASRLRFTIEEFSEVALKSKNPPRIAGRCTVFAKSDMIHLQQIATPDYEIVAGLCYALARNFKGNIAKGKDVMSPVAFVGGVAANSGMRRAIMEVFLLQDSQFFVPEHFTSMGAIGAVYTVLDEPDLRQQFAGLENIERRLTEKNIRESHDPLTSSKRNLNISYALREIEEKTLGYLGVDVGSISTNLVIIDEDRNVIAKRYLMTEGRPLEAVKKGLAEIGEEVEGKVEILGAGTTGSGRYLTADFIGADIVRNEITAQAEAAININPQVDTIFEIGGQDSKYISVDNGVIVDFEMNKACAAGTGSFLEEQAERLGISIKDDFGNLALSARRPVKMGERCTVFIESDLVHYQQRGARTDDLVSGLSYSIVTNYLNKVVGDRRVADNIFFQGGTAFNKGVVAAFEQVLNKPVVVPPHHDVTGAIGVAILAMKEKTWGKSGFKGFDLSKRQYEIDTFECKGCENLCEIRKVTVEKEPPLFYGSRCEKYDVVRKTERRQIEDLVKFREDLLNTIYDKQVQGEVIGIPKLLNMTEYLPLWKAFFSELGFSVVLSDMTNKKIIREGVETIIVESCFPVKLAHGHVLNLINKGVKRIFMPSVINFKKTSKSAPNSFACPYAQSLPYTVRASVDFAKHDVTLECPVIYFGEGKERALKNLLLYGEKLGKSKRQIVRALDLALEVQETFYRRIRERGLQFLSNAGKDERIIVIIGRPYNSLDPGANLNIHKKLMDLGVSPIPIDMIPLTDDVEPDAALEHMYWGYGQKILRAAKFLRNNANHYGVYVTNFGCGPDSFITHSFRRTMGDKPFLQLEIDEHSADAGIITRLEAFLDSIKNAKPQHEPGIDRKPPIVLMSNNRKIYIPYMSDHSIAIAGAFRACGVEAHVFPESDEETVFCGRKHTTGRECYPCILTTGDMLKLVRTEDPDKLAFFMPSGGGPCRFGQYHLFHRTVLDEMGFENVPIYAPNQDHRLYKELNMVGGRFTRLGWKALVATDMIIKMLHEIRPFEEKKGETDKVYREALATVVWSIEKGSDTMIEVLHDVVRKFLSIGKKNARKPIVGVVGEIYIRSNRFSNDNLVRKIEEFGGQVWLAPIAEWIGYINYTNKKRMQRRKSFSDTLNVLMTDYIQRKDEHAMERIFTDHLLYGKEPKIEDIISKARPYIHESFEGEAILSVGKAVDFIDKGISGVINVMPFTCMPGTISSALMRLIQKEHDVPILNLAYDGQGSTNISTRLEAFMYQVKEQLRADE